LFKWFRIKIHTLAYIKLILWQIRVKLPKIGSKKSIAERDNLSKKNLSIFQLKKNVIVTSHPYFKFICNLERLLLTLINFVR